MQTDKVIIYTDGACSGNQNTVNKGGWGAILLWKDKSKELFGGEKNSTNNRMELKAVIEALKALKTQKLSVDIYSDSAYIVNCFKQKWYEKWENNGWKNAKKEKVENRDLWEELIALYRSFNQVTFIKIKGHAGNKYNERADELARQGVKTLDS